jgi:hypothetical protein
MGPARFGRATTQSGPPVSPRVLSVPAGAVVAVEILLYALPVGLLELRDPCPRDELRAAPPICAHGRQGRSLRCRQDQKPCGPAGSECMAQACEWFKSQRPSRTIKSSASASVPALEEAGKRSRVLPPGRRHLFASIGAAALSPAQRRGVALRIQIRAPRARETSRGLPRQMRAARATRDMNHKAEAVERALGQKLDGGCLVSPDPVRQQLGLLPYYCRASKGHLSESFPSLCFAAAFFH